MKRKKSRLAGHANLRVSLFREFSVAFFYFKGTLLVCLKVWNAFLKFLQIRANCNKPGELSWSQAGKLFTRQFYYLKWSWFRLYGHNAQWQTNAMPMHKCYNFILKFPWHNLAAAYDRQVTLNSKSTQRLYVRIANHSIRMIHKVPFFVLNDCIQSQSQNVCF